MAKAHRRVAKMDTYGDGETNPTRVNPQTLKTTTSNTSFVKTLSRVILDHGSKPQKSYQAVIEIVRHHMPFMDNHYRKVRSDIHTKQHLEKEVRDALGSVIPTLKRYKAPYPNPRLSARKQAEVMLAIEVISKDMILTETYVKERLGPVKDEL